MTDASPTPTKKKSKKQEDLTIPDFLLVKNRDPEAAEQSATVTASGRIMEDWEVALANLKPDTLREYVTDAMRRGRFERTWLVVSHKRSQSDVDETVAHWQAKLDASLSQSAARAAQAQSKRKEGKVQPPEKVSPDAVIRFGGSNPKPPGSAAHKRWEFLMAHDGKTVGAYQKAKGNPTTLKNAIVSGHVTLEEGGDAEVAPAKAERGKKKHKK